MDRENEQADVAADDGDDQTTSTERSLLQGFDGAVEPQRAELGTIEILSPFVERRREDEDRP